MFDLIALPPLAPLAVLPALFPDWIAEIQGMAGVQPERCLLAGFVNLLFAAALTQGVIALAEGRSVDAAGVPLIWLVLFPYALLLGFGALILALWERCSRRGD